MGFVINNQTFQRLVWGPLICIDCLLSIRLLDEAYFNRILQNVSRRGP